MRRAITFLLVVASLIVLVPSTASAATGYTDPTFGATCEVHRFGEGEWPPLWMYDLDPLCVEYSKRDITVDNGGALRFLLAEPSRFAIALPSCTYWQVDHWSVQVTTGGRPLVAWDGSYWFDKRARVAAAHLLHFRINGQPAGIGDVVIALRPQFPELADILSRYGATHGESGMGIALPYSPWCEWR